MSLEDGHKRKSEVKDAMTERIPIVTVLLEIMKEMMKVESLEEETTIMAKMLVVIRVTTEQINMWTRQLEMKRRVICELAVLMGSETIKQEIQKESSLGGWAKNCSNHFTKKVKRMLFGEIDNMVWSVNEKQVTQWCRKNEVFDQGLPNKK